MSELIVQATDIWKEFKIPHEKKHTIFEEVVGLVGLAKGRRMSFEEFWALKGVSFELQSDDRLGLVGANGSGKTTLLKVVAGITPPTRGSVQVRGKIASILQLGVAFHPELTVKDNILLYSSVMGIRGQEARRRIRDILEFAGGGVDKFIDAKLKALSSGMQMRLAFAVAISTEPDIFFIDEALAVGDIEFQHKCLDTFESYKGKKAMIVVTHDVTMLTRFCNKAIWLSQGKIVAEGDPNEIAAKYEEFMEHSDLIAG